MLQLWLENTWRLALDSAPWLVFGLLAAGLIRAWVPMERVARTLGGAGPVAVIKAALIGAPLPLCSCSTLPAAISLRRSGASKASTTSFLIATPETGVDSIALSWVLLGPWFALIRPVAAVISAISAGLLVGRIEARPAPLPVMQPAMAVAPPQTSSCCSDDCGCSASQTSDPPGLTARTWEGIQYAFTTLLDDLALWLAVAMLAAGAVITLFPGDFLAAWGSGLLPMLAILLISIPMYVCATASTPLAHAMLFAGVSPGTVLVFLLAGPASNIGSLALIRRELGNRSLTAYLIGIGGMSILLGLGLDALLQWQQWDLLTDLAHRAGEEEVVGPFALFSLLFLIAMAIPPMRRFLRLGKADEEGNCCG